MITITIGKQNQNIITIEAKGHSGYALAGQDIVCSAISTLLQNLINSLETILNIKTDYVVDENKPMLKVSLPSNLEEKKFSDAQLLMKSAVLGVENVAESYDKFIKIKEKQYD